MSKLVVVKWGKREFTVVSTHWEPETQEGRIHYTDALGERYLAFSQGLSPTEQRQAVVDDVLQRARRSRGLA